jgi:hypothetical protein
MRTSLIWLFFVNLSAFAIQTQQHMLPSKRSSPFVRTRSFQDRNSKDRTDADGAPLAKRPFTRTMSTPFQVVTTSLKGTKNPFEKLAVAPSHNPASNSLSTDYAALHIDEDQTDDLQVQ